MLFAKVPCPLPFRFTICEYFNCRILSKAESTSSSVNKVKFSVLWRDCEKKTLHQKQYTVYSESLYILFTLLIVFPAIPTHTTPRSYLIQIIHEHLTHFIDRDGGIDGTVEPQFANSVGQSTEMKWIWMGQKHRIHLMDISETAIIESKTGQNKTVFSSAKCSEDRKRLSFIHVHPFSLCLTILPTMPFDYLLIVGIYNAFNSELLISNIYTRENSPLTGNYYLEIL